MEKKTYKISEISDIVGGIANINEDITINKVLPPLLADEKTLALALSEEEIQNLNSSKAKVALVPLGVSIETISTIEVERPRLAMMKLLHLFYEAPDTPSGIHPSAIVHPEAKLGQNVSIGANVFIGREAKIGDNTKILPNCYIGKRTQIGDNCLFHANCTIGDFIKIGNRVVLNHGASIGADGFSFVTETPDNIETARREGEVKNSKENQKIYKIPSLGSVVIGDDVEIGANSTIDRGTIENTTIGNQTKIDNLVMIGHNCQIGEACMIVSQVGIAGSCKIGNRVVIAGQAGLADHITIGDDCIILAQAGVTKSFPAKTILIGAPAQPRKDFLKHMKLINEVEEMARKYKKYQHLLEDYEKFLKETP